MLKIVVELSQSVQKLTEALNAMASKTESAPQRGRSRSARRSNAFGYDDDDGGGVGGGGVVVVVVVQD